MATGFFRVHGKSKGKKITLTSFGTLILNNTLDEYIRLLDFLKKVKSILKGQNWYWNRHPIGILYRLWPNFSYERCYERQNILCVDDQYYMYLIRDLY